MCELIIIIFSMSKTKPQYGLEQEILVMIYKLIQKKTSKIFRQPVDITVVPDYYEKIKNPIDIATMIKRLKQEQYYQARQIRKDLDLMMANCRLFNGAIEILRIVEKFEKSIDTEWINFQKELKRKNISIDTPIKITEEILKNFEFIEDKNNNRKPSNLQSVLGQLQINNKKTQAQYKILPPIPQQLIQNDKGENQLPKTLWYTPQKYLSYSKSERQVLFHFEINKEDLSNTFEEVSIKKLAKYKKILFNKVMWIENKIIKKCLERKRFRKMATPQFLSTYLQNGEIASNLQLRKIQMYIKMVAYWIEEYPTILSYTMKNKFIQSCRSIKRSIFRVLRYRKMPRSTKIQLDLNFNEAEMSMKYQNNLESKEQFMGEDQSRRYDNQIKSFKRMLSKDQGETIKKYTKIQIKNENGEFTVVDWNIENNDKKKTNRSSGIGRALENTEEIMRLQKQKRRREQRQQDETFLANYRTKSATELLSCYSSVLMIDWDEIRSRKLPKIIEAKFDHFIYV